MLDKNDLQAIGELIHAEVSASEARTKEYIDNRFSEQAEYVDGRFSEQKEYIDSRFSEQAEYVDGRFSEQKEYIDSRFSEQAEYVDGRFSEQKEYIDHRVGMAQSHAIAFAENEITKRLDAIKEGLDLALETHIPAERIERIEENIIALKSVVRKHSEEIDLLKKAQ